MVLCAHTQKKHIVPGGRKEKGKWERSKVSKLQWQVLRRLAARWVLWGKGESSLGSLPKNTGSEVKTQGFVLVPFTEGTLGLRTLASACAHSLNPETSLITSSLNQNKAACKWFYSNCKNPFITELHVTFIDKSWPVTRNKVIVLDLCVLCLF